MPQRVEVPGMGVVEFPDGMTDDQIVAAIKASQPQAQKAPTRAELWKREGMALLSPFRGAKDVIDTGAEWLSKLAGPEEAARVKAMNDAGKAEFSEDTKGSMVAPVGRLVGQAAATIPATNLLGAGLTSAGLSRLGSAVTSGGMTTGAGPVGALAKTGDMAIRMAGGGISVGASAGLIEPADARTGAVIGAALPPALQGIGTAGKAIGSALRGPQSAAAHTLAKALDGDPKAMAKALREAQELVPGSQPTVAQALRTPQAGILERVVSDSKGGAGLKERYAAQNTARLQAVDAVAPTDPRGFRSAQQEVGTALEDFARKGDAAARSRTSGLYNAVPQDEAALYLPDLAATRDKFFGRGAFVDRGPADRAVATAQQLSDPGIGTRDLPRNVEVPQTLAKAVRKRGGLSTAGDLGGEVRALDAKNLRRSAGLTLDEMAEAMHERGLIGDESADSLIDAMRAEALGGRGLAGSGVWEQQRRAAMGDAPTAAKVTLREFDNLRKSIGIEARTAKKAGNDTLARSLDEMRTALDARLEEVVRGDGAIDEVMPVDWANTLDAARKSKLEQVQRFRTGPQASIFRTGADGLPQAQGGEVAAKFWGHGPGAADNVQALRQLIADDPKLLERFRGMVTTEGVGTATNGGQLTGKFARWADNARPGLAAAFDPEQLAALERIAQDVRRAEQGAAAGMSRGSNTYQNASHALSMGLLDSKIADFAANRVPVLGTGFDWAREAARDARARRLAGLLADPQAAAAALEALNGSGLLSDPVRLGLHRAGPLLGTGQ
jgi:hypothetical protein